MTTTIGTVNKIEIEDTSKTARVDIIPTSPPGPLSTFKVTNDNDSSYGAMVSVLVLARLVSFDVTIEHVADKEIDKLTF